MNRDIDNIDTNIDVVMNIQQLHYVLTVAKMKHFEKAAEACFVSQSTLSTMVGKLEDEMGIRIFDRKTKPVGITQEGRRLLDQIQIILKEINVLDNVVQELKGEMSGELRMGIIPTIAPYLLPLFLSRFAALFPKVQMVIEERTTAELQKGLKNRLLDIGIVAIPLSDTELVEYPLYREPFLFYDHFSGSLPERVGPEDIEYSKLWLLQEGHCLRTQVERICELSQHRSNPHAINFEFRAGSIDSLIRFTKANNGVTLLPHLSTLDFDDREKDRLRPFRAPIPTREIGLLVHKHFVKKELLLQLQRIITESVAPLLTIKETEKMIHPQ